MNNKREARLRYYEGIRGAMVDHFEATEDGLRKLKDVKPAKVEKIVTDLHKQHEKLLRRIDRQINLERDR